MTAPSPSLTYTFHRVGHPSGDGIVGTGSRLATVIEVSAWLERNGQVVMYARGPILRKDGTPGRVRRARSVWLTHRQPQWLADIIADAVDRLSIDLSGSSGTSTAHSEGDTQ